MNVFYCSTIINRLQKNVTTGKGIHAAHGSPVRKIYMLSGIVYMSMDIGLGNGVFVNTNYWLECNSTPRVLTVGVDE